MLSHFAGDPLRQHPAQRLAELSLHLRRVRGQVELAPAQRLGSVHEDLDRSRDAALRVEGQVGGMRGNGVLGEVGRRHNAMAHAVGGLQQTSAKHVRPAQLTIGKKLFAGIEEDVRAVDVQHDQVDGQLIEREIAGIEDALAAVGHAHAAGLQAGGAGQREIQRGNLVRRPALLAPHLLRAAHRAARAPAAPAPPHCVRGNTRCCRGPAPRRTACALSHRRWRPRP